MAITGEEVTWAYRVLLSRDPESEDVARFHMHANESLRDLARSLIDTGEFKSIYKYPPEYAVPPFLIPTPCHGRIEIEEPSLAFPTSQLCTYSQTQEAYYKDFSRLAELDPNRVHRKHWELAYIWRVLDSEGLLAPGRNGLVFAVGSEPLPSIFAARGCKIMASDGPDQVGAVWSENSQHARDVISLWKPAICPQDVFRENVAFRVIDMTAIPQDLEGFDFLWSACSLEHLGSIEEGITFVRKAMAALRPGGIAVHTTEFNLSSNATTADCPPTCLFRRQDIEALAQQLRQDGHTVRRLNFWPGSEPLDAHIDFPPFAAPHLKLILYHFVSTSIGLIIEKGPC